MAITFQCPNGHTLQVKDQHAGFKLKCPRCRVPMTVPLPGVVEPVANESGAKGTGAIERPRSDSKPRSRFVRSRRTRRKTKKKRGQTDGYLASANLAEEPGAKADEEQKSSFASPFTASYLDYMDGNRRRGNYGGMNRLDYFIGGLISGVVIAVFAAFAIHMESTIMLGLFMLASLCAQLWLGSERCVNLGLDGPWCLLMLVPCIGPLFGVLLTIAPEGFADHKKMDQTGYILLVVILFVVPALTLFILAAAMATAAV